jgi:hypothetical protein
VVLQGGGEGLNSVVGLRGIVGMLCGLELQVLGGCHYFDNRFKSFVRKGLFKEEKVFAKVEIANTEFPTKFLIDMDFRHSS